MGFFTLRNGLTGRHVLAALIGFFGLMGVANAFFVYFALGTFNGFESRDAYRKGVAYNEQLAADEAQASLGWKTSTLYDQARKRLLVRIADASGAPVAGLSGKAELRRPVTDRDDRGLELREAASGVYEAEVSLAAGQWIVAAELFSGAGEAAPVYRIKQRLWVKEGS